MILRRLGSTLKRQDWPALTLELLVLTIGILGALAVEALWQDRLDVERKIEYLQQLSSDIDETLLELDSAVVNNERMAARMDSLLDAFVASEPPSDSVFRRLNNAGYAWAEPITGAAVALIETGDLRLIEDTGLRAGIVRYLGQSDEYIRSLDAFVWNWGGPNFEKMYKAVGRTDPRLPFADRPVDLLRDPEYFDAVQALRLAYSNFITRQADFAADVRVLQGLTAAYLADERVPESR